MPHTSTYYVSDCFSKISCFMTTSHSPKIDSQKPWINQWDTGFLMNAMYVESCGSSNRIWYIMSLYIHTQIYTPRYILFDIDCIYIYIDIICIVIYNICRDILKWGILKSPLGINNNMVQSWPFWHLG